MAERLDGLFCREPWVRRIRDAAEPRPGRGRLAGPKQERVLTAAVVHGSGRLAGNLAGLADAAPEAPAKRRPPGAPPRQRRSKTHSAVIAAHPLADAQS